MNVTSVAEIGCKMDRRFEDGTDGTFCWIDWGDEIGIDWGDEIGIDWGDEIGMDWGDEIGIDWGDEIGIDWGDGIGIDWGDGIGIDWGDDVTPPLDCDEISTDWDNPVPFTSSLLTPWYCLPYAISNLQLIIFIHFLLNTW